MKLTCGKLLKRDNWLDWHNSEFLQLNQYDAQGMFGNPVAAANGDAIFHLVWTYVIKALDGCKKARCVCDGSTRSGLVQVLDETYANCINQTSSRLFYVVAAAENLLVLGQMSPMHLLKRLPRKRVSTYALIKPSTTGGFNIRNVRQSQPVTLFQSYLQCKATLNPHDFGRNTLTPYCGSLD
jgi:hypothetical protein